MDWPVLLPILVCSILVLGVVISKWSFYQKNQRDITVYMRELNRELSKNDLSAAQNIAIRCGGVIGEVIEEAVKEMPKDVKKGSEEDIKNFCKEDWLYRLFIKINSFKN